MMRIGRRLLGALAGVVVAVGLPHGTALADPAGPTDFRSEVVSIEPATDAVAVTIEGGDSFVRVVVAPGHELIALGYEGEPYLRIDADGRVERNARSFATYYNANRYGDVDPPAIVDPDAPPLWERVGDGGSWAWHDHRVHWMGTEPPVGMEPGDALPTQVVPLVVDGVAVDVHVVTRLVGGPSPWPALLGVLVGLQVVLLASLAGDATATLGALTLGGAATVVGVAQFRSLPAETGPLVTWWLLPVLAVAAALATILLYGRSRLVHLGLLMLSGVFVLLWAFRRRQGLTRPVLPTDLPFWFDRATTGAALAGGAALVAVSMWRLYTSGGSSSGGRIVEGGP